ncbi:MAG: CBS domain-containing protein [Planctomycetota bacterium]
MAELSGHAFSAFCDDISGMFGVSMSCSEGRVSTETVASLQNRFEKLVAVNCVRSEGALEGTFQMIFDRKGLFILAGLITMPEQMTNLLEKCVLPAKIQTNIKNGSLKEAREVSDSLSEAGNLMVGSWDRVFREELENHKHFAQSTTFIGEPWDNSDESISLSRDEEFTFVSFDMTISEYPPFACGVIFPETIFGKAKTAEKIKAEAEAKVRAEAEEKARAETEAQAEADAQAQAEAEEKAKLEAEKKAITEAEERAKEEEELRAKAEAEARAKIEAEQNAKRQAETQSQAGSEPEGEEETETETPETTEVEEEPKAEGVEGTEVEAEPQAEAGGTTEVEEGAEAEDEEQAKAESTEEADDEIEGEPDGESERSSDDGAAEQAEVTADVSQAPPLGGVSEAIHRMTDSPAVLPGQAVSVYLGAPAKEIMQTDIVWSRPDDSVQQALTQMQQQDVGYLMVGVDGVLEGILSNSNVTGAISPYLRPVFSKWRRPLDDASLNIRIKWIMSRPVRTIKPETPLAVILENMRQFSGRCLPVADDQGNILGLVTVFDIFKVLEVNVDVSSSGKTAQAPPLV